MNKTLCAGLVAFGIAFSAFAEEKEAQVYDLTVTVKRIVLITPALIGFAVNHTPRH